MVKIFNSKGLLILLVVFFLLISCHREDEPSGKDTRLKVVATIFPLYDFARQIGGDKINVTMLLPPASDPHHYELTPKDIIRVSQADIFLFTSFDMEQWAYKIIDAAAAKTNMLPVETGQGAFLLLPPVSGEKREDPHEPHGQRDEEHAAKFDPHIWLDLSNAQKMVDNIEKAFITKDPKNSETYKQKAATYKKKLIELDQKYVSELNRCKTRTILHAGHWAFAYLAARYKLNYRSAYNMSADAEPTPLQVVTLIEQIRKQKLTHIYYEDLMAPKLAKTVAGETGAQLLKLSNGHDVCKKDIQAGETFISLMERNLINLKKGMQCP